MESSGMSYGKTRYIHKETEKVFVAWVTTHSSYMQSLQDKPIWLTTLEKEFHQIKEQLPEEVIDELVAIVDAREAAKIMHLANNTHDEGHEYCLRMYKGFLQKARQQMIAASPSPPPSPTSEEEFPAIGTPKSISPPPSSPSSSSSPTWGKRLSAIDSPKPLPPTPRDSTTKRLFRRISSDPPTTTTKTTTTPPIMRTGSVKRQRLVLKLRSNTSASQNVAAC